MEDIFRTIKKRIRSLNLEDSVEAARICSIAQKIGNGVFVAKKFKNGILTVSVGDQASAADLYMNAGSLQKKINKEIKNNLVQKIRVVTY